MARSNGLNLQATVSGHLKNLDFKLQHEEEWDHNNKIDFVITKFPKYPKLVQIGVQVTSRCNDDAKRGEFVAKNDPNGGNITVAEKALYLEIEENVDINKGGAELVANVLYAYQFDEQFADAKVWAATIQAKSSSITYRFFDPKRVAGGSQIDAPKIMPPPIAAPLANLSGTAEQLNRVLKGQPNLIEGKLHTYQTEKGFGFILAQDGNTYYMHISDVKDNSLRDNLGSLMRMGGKASTDFDVIFENGGKTKAEATYPTARNVRMAA